MKKLVVLLLILLIPSVLALSSQQWINTHQLQQISKIGTNLKFEVHDGSGKIVNRDPNVGESFTLSADDDFVWSKVLVYPDAPLGVISNFDLNVQQISHTVQVGTAKKVWYQRRGRPIFANYYTNSGVSNEVNTTGWKPQDYHLTAYTCTTNRNQQWQSTGVWDCSWKVYTFTLKGKVAPAATTNCGNNKCDINEDPNNCAKDCPDAIFCGNHRCDPGENLNNCVEDRTACWDFVNSMTHCPNMYTNTNEHCDPLAANNKFMNPWTKPFQTPVTCQTLGFKGGQLDCLPNCLISTNSCYNTVCGDNVCETGETPQSCALDCMIGPLPSKNVANCITPPQPQQSVWKIDTNTVLCPGKYKLDKGVEINKQAIFDCNNAEIEGDMSGNNEQFHIFSDNVELKNCNFVNLLITTDSIVQGQPGALNAGPLRSNIKINNNNFKNYAYIIGAIANGEIRKNYIPAFQLYNGAVNNDVSENKGVVLVRLNSRANNNKISKNDIEKLELFFNTENNIIENNKIKLLTLGWLLSFTGAAKNKISNNDIELLRLREGSNQNSITENKLNNLVFEKASSNTVEKNTINAVSSQYFALLILNIGSDKNKIESNSFNGNNLGIIGIGLESDENEFSKNSIENTDVGVHIVGPSRKNDFFRNNFINSKTKHVEDATTFNQHEKNYYSGFSDDPSKCKDANNDSLCDDPYTITPAPAPNYGPVEDKSPSKIKN
ncbi:hypothetical protein HY837_03320 [archaeon]|nr:hypothetical protein [archaeon]